ncbi:MAG: putative Na+/H+ antiporter [Pseudomonadota bacterium]
MTSVQLIAALMFALALAHAFAARSFPRLAVRLPRHAGLTVIANAPNPAGVALLRAGFRDEAAGVGALLLGALPPTIVAMLFLFLL